MKKAVYLFYLALSMLFFYGCEKSPYVPKAVIDHIRDSIANAKRIEHIAFIYNNDVYYLGNIDVPAVRLTNTPALSKTKVALSHDLQKIAYINSAGNPEIIDRNGSITATLTSYTSVTQMDWSNDDATLYMLIGNSFSYYGAPISHPPLNFSGVPGTMQQVLSATLSKDNDLAYVVEYFDPFAGYQQRLILKKNDGSGTWVNYDNPYTFNQMRYAKFSPNDKDLVVAYDDGVGSSPRFPVVDLFTGLKNFPDSGMPLCSSCESCFPVYRSDKKCVVSIYNDGSDTFIPTAIFINDLVTKKRSEYSASTAVSSIDWK
ncbi:MAG: hypothetical protein ACJ77K_01195 [Bacteroidia bacterium]